jgi:ATP-dependent RNA helicase DDX19/DBP5
VIDIDSFIPQKAQVLLFSATFPDQVRVFAQRFSPAANEITLKTEELSVEGIKQLYMDCRDENHKYEVLVGLYGLMNIGQSIIFVAVLAPFDGVIKVNLFSVVILLMRLPVE